MSSGTHRFRCFTPVDTSRVWIALTDGQATGRFHHGLVADSSWCTDAPIHFWAPPVERQGQSELTGRVLCALPCRRLSYPEVRFRGPMHLPHLGAPVLSERIHGASPS